MWKKGKERRGSGRTQKTKKREEEGQEISETEKGVKGRGNKRIYIRTEKIEVIKMFDEGGGKEEGVKTEQVKRVNEK